MPLFFKLTGVDVIHPMLWQKKIHNTSSVLANNASYIISQIPVIVVAEKTRFFFLHRRTYFYPKHLGNTIGTLLNQSMASKTTKTKSP
jgi:hypothetical protein